MKILVTGAKGFVGKNLCAELRNIKDGKSRCWGDLVVDEVFEYDVDSTSEELDEWCKVCDFVFNLAGVNRPRNQEEFMEGNLFDFIEEYAMNILNRSDRLKVQVVRSDTEGIEMKFVPQNIAIILDNVVSNSTKYNANELRVLLGKDEKQYTIDFIDDGDGVSSDIADLNELFEFGTGYTLTGTGVGLYHIKDIVEKDLQGTVTIESEPQKGFALHVRFGKV